MIQKYDATIGEMISLDPAFGLHSSVGVAHWRNGKLVGCARLRLEPISEKEAQNESDGARCQRMGRTVLNWIDMRKAVPRTYVYEWPQVYRAARSPGDPNDLIGLAAVGASVGMGLQLLMAQRNLGLTILTQRPCEWAGQLPKVKSGDPWKSQRGQRIAVRITPDEREVIPRSHDAMDAVGIGLYSLGRFERRRVFPGAT
jgi:hypothetical protein